MAIQSIVPHIREMEKLGIIQKLRSFCMSLLAGLQDSSLAEIGLLKILDPLIQWSKVSQTGLDNIISSLMLVILASIVSFALFKAQTIYTKTKLEWQ